MTSSSNQVEQDARSQAAGALKLYRDLEPDRGELLETLREQPYAGMGLLENLMSTAASLLAIGQCAYVLGQDVDTAVATFRELDGWLPFVDAAEAASSSGDAEQPPLNPRLLIEPIVCWLLGGSSKALQRCGKISEDVLERPEELSAVQGPWAQFGLDLLHALRDNDAAVVAALPPTFVKKRPKDIIVGYDALLRCVVERDAEQFHRVRDELAIRFRERAKSKTDALIWTGEGTVSQAATFDALGTAICTLAVRRGMKVATDDPLYPGCFYRTDLR